MFAKCLFCLLKWSKLYIQASVIDELLTGMKVYTQNKITLKSETKTQATLQKFT